MNDDGIPQLSDFGRSRFIDHRGFTTTLAGSARYMAPELISAESDVNFDDDAYDALENQASPKLTKETDVFAFSMVALEVSEVFRFPILQISRASARLFILTALLRQATFWLLITNNFVQILTGKLPFFYLRQDTTVIAYVQDGKRPERGRCLPTTFTDPTWSLLVDCWDADPVNRPNMGTVVGRLWLMSSSFFGCYSLLYEFSHMF